MKMSIVVTLDGLLRALRWRAHDLAEQAEQGYRAGISAPRESRRTVDAEMHGKGKGNDRIGR